MRNEVVLKILGMDYMKRMVSMATPYMILRNSSPTNSILSAYSRLLKFVSNYSLDTYLFTVVRYVNHLIYIFMDINYKT